MTLLLTSDSCFLNSCFGVFTVTGRVHSCVLKGLLMNAAARPSLILDGRAELS